MGEPDGRLTRLTRDEISPEARGLWDAIAEGRGGAVDAEGRMSGPFNVWLQSPQAGRHLLALGGSLREETVLDRSLNELAVCVSTAYWRANFPFIRHAAAARKSGIADSVLDALAAGERPTFEDDQHELTYQVASSVVRTSGLSTSLHARALSVLGERQLVEVVLVCGWYTLVSFAVNAFEVPTATGQMPLWEKLGGLLSE